MTASRKAFLDDPFGVLVGLELLLAQLLLRRDDAIPYDGFRVPECFSELFLPGRIQNPFLVEGADGSLMDADVVDVVEVA